MIRIAPAATTTRSGLTGDPDLGDGAAGRRPRSWRQRLVGAGRAAAGTVTALNGALRLCWAASRPLTLGLMAGTVVSGLVPAATAVIARLLLNLVVEGFIRQQKQLPELILVQLPVPGGHVRLGHFGPLPGLLVLAALQIAVLTVSAAAQATSRVCQQLLQERVSQAVQLEVMHVAGRQDLAFFEDSRSYDVLQQVQRETSLRPVSMVSGLCSTLQATVTLASLGALLFLLQPWLALATLAAPVPAFVAESRYGMRGFQLALWAAPIRRRMDYLVSLSTTDTAAKEVRLNGIGPYLAERYRLLGAVAYGRTRRLAASRSLVGGLLGILTTVAGAAFTVYVGWQALRGRLSLGDLALYTAAIGSVQLGVTGLFGGVTALHENGLYLENLRRLRAEQPGITAPERPVELPVPVAGRLEFEHVTFTYPRAAAPALDDVSLVVEGGTTTAVVGVNGAGKSTLVKLVGRLYEPQQGRITLDGVDLRDLDPHQLRRRLAVMFQDYVTYQATAAENIGLGDPARIEDEAAIRAAAGRAGALGDLDALPKGLATPLGKWFAGGAQLSGGQWQKVALGRAFLRDAPVLLLDEPTAALDAAAEAELFERLGELTAGRTAIYVSHRFSTVRRADRIVVLEHGRLIEAGTHRELVGAGGEYARLYGLQAAAYSDDAPVGFR